MSDKSNIVKSIKALTLGVVCVCCSAMAAFSTENTLSTVEIKDSDNGYQIVLKADKSAEVRKTVESRDNISLLVKGLIPSESVGTIYNNVPQVENVMIEEQDSENTKITIQGDGIAASTVKFAPIETVEVPAVEKKSDAPEIELSQPINTYSPVYPQEEVFEDTPSDSLLATAFSLSVDSARGAKPYLVKLYHYVKQLDKKVLGFGALFMMIILFGLRSFKSNNDDDMKIGLAQSLKDRELSMRDQLTFAQDAPLLNSQKSLINKNVPSINYGIKAYQNSQRNPYTSQIPNVQTQRPIARPQAAPLNRPIQKPIQGPKMPVQNRVPQQQVPLQKRTQQNNLATAPQGLNRVQPEPFKTIPGTKNVDSLKFLESMSRIYERSGRADLASELKSNIQRVQVNQ